jgi:hypothetical protein
VYDQFDSCTDYHHCTSERREHVQEFLSNPLLEIQIENVTQKKLETKEQFSRLNTRGSG